MNDPPALTVPAVPAPAVDDLAAATGDSFVDSRGRVFVEVAGTEMPAGHTFSGLRDYEFCGTRWAYRQIGPVQNAPTAPAAAVGSAVHSMMAGLRRSNNLTELWVDAALDNPYAIPHKSQVMRIVEQALEWDLSAAALARSISAEYRAVGTVAGVEMRARIDLLEWDQTDGLVVSDWKTGDTPLGWSETTQIRQSVLYARLVRDDTEFGEPKRARMYFLGDREMTDIDLDTAAGKHAAVEAERFVGVNTSRMNVSVDESLFVAHPGHWCDACPYQQVCPASTVTGGTGDCADS